MRSRDNFDVIEIASQKLRILSLLGENNISLSYLTQHLVSGKKLILNIVDKPSFSDVKPILIKKQALFEEIFSCDEEIKAKYREYSSKAGFEIYLSALSAQVYLQTKLLSSSYPHFPKLAYIHQDDSAWYMALDFIEGCNIYEYLNKQENLNEELIFSLMLQLIDALSSVHKFPLGPLLYANLTPSNIIINESGELYIVDFFKIRFPEDDSIENNWQHVISENSPGPFQPIEGYSDYRSEIYAFGVLFYYCLTGVFVQNSKERLKLDRLIPLGNLSDKYSIKLEKILNFCMELAPDRRFQSFEDIKSAILCAEFGTVFPSHATSPLKDLALGDIPKHTDKKITVILKKPINFSAVPFILEKFICEWTLKPETDEPILTVLQSQEHKNSLSVALKLSVPDAISQGNYEAKCSFITTWGKADFKLSFEIFKLSPFLHPAMGMLYALLFVLLMFCFHTKDGSKISQWGKSWWTLTKAGVDLSYYKAEISEQNFWLSLPDKKEVKLDENNLNINKQGLKKYEKKGIISSFYSPVSAKAEISVVFACDFKNSSSVKACVMFFSSNSSALSVSFENEQNAAVSIIQRGKVLKQKKINISKFISPDSKNINIKIGYFILEEKLVCSIETEEIIFENFEIVDYAIFIYGASLKENNNINFDFFDIKIDAGSALAKIPPYYMASTGKYSVLFKDDLKSQRVFTVLKDELLEVCEVRGKWLRVRQSSGETEGWITSEKMRVPKPFETIP